MAACRHGDDAISAILARLRQEIAAADYPYPIDQDLGELAAQSAELRDSLVWAPGRIIADIPIDMPRPRDLRIKRSPEFVAIADRIWDLIAPQLATAAGAARE